MKRHIRTFSIALISLSLLSGCNTLRGSVSTPEIAPITINNGPISVDDLLAQARGLSGAQVPMQNLTLRFEDGRTKLSSDHQQQLNGFANSHNARQINVQCSPASDNSKLTAMSIAISRCQLISEFLESRTHQAVATVNPRLIPNEIYISVAE